MRSRKAIASVAVLLGLGFIALATFGVRGPDFQPPVPIDRLGMPIEAVEPTQQFISSLPGIAVVGADSDAENQRKRVVLDSLLLKANGGEWPWHGPQETGDCGSHAHGISIEIDEAAQIDSGADIEFRPTCRMWLYSGGRCRNGKVAMSGQGSIPAWISDFIESRGVLWQDADGVPAYSGSEADKWGRQCPPERFASEAGQYLVTNVVAVRSAQDVCNAICAGYAVPFGSMQFGTDSIKLVEGRNVARDTANWPHAQCVTGYDGTLKNGQRLFRIVNSWGPVETWLRKPGVMSQMPGDHPGGYYVTWETMESICREGMVFAVSGTQGFRKREFIPDFSVIGAAAPAEAQTLQESEIMPTFSHDFGMPFLLIGLLLIAFGLIVQLVGNRGGRRIAAAVMLLAVMTSVTQAQEFQPNFEALTVAAMPTGPYQTSGPRTASDPVFVPDFSALTIAAQPSPINRAACDACTCPNCVCAECDGQTCTALVAQASRRRAQGVQALLDASNATVETPPPKPAPKAPSEPTGFPVTISGNWMYWQANGVNWDNSGTGVRDGYSYGDRWVYRNGRMLEIGPAKPAPRPPAAFMPQSSAGHWVNQCQGGVCKLTWVPN